MPDNKDVVIYSGSDAVLDLKSAVVQSEDHTADNEVVEQTLENGSPMTDHIIIKPDLLEISFVITNVESINGHTQPLTGERAKTVWQELKRIRNTRTLLTVLTAHELYEDMAIESLSGSHQAPNRGQLSYTIKLKKVNVTNFNVGKNSSRFFDTGSKKKKGAKEKIEEVLNSAIDMVDRGFVNPSVARDNPGRAEEIINLLFDEDVNIENMDKEISEKYEAKKKSLVDSIKLVRVWADKVSKFYSIVNGSVLKMSVLYNSLLGHWLLDVENSDAMTGLIGLPMFKGENMFEGHRTKMPTDNLFASKKYSEQGEEIFYLYYFEKGALKDFDEFLKKSFLAKKLNFSIDDLDYTVSKVDSSFGATYCRNMEHRSR